MATIPPAGPDPPEQPGPKQRFSRFRRWVESWYVLAATIFYIGAIIATIIGGFIAIITFILSFANRTEKYLLYDPFGSLLNDRLALFLLNNRWPITGIFLILVSTYAQAHYRHLRRKLQSMRVLGQIAHEYNGILQILRTHTLTNPGHGEQQINDLCESIYRFFVSSANRISAQFEIYTGTRCHVSIKLYKAGQIKTIARDDRSLEDRGKIDSLRGWYSCEGITQYESIVQGDVARAFRCNHLWLALRLGRYRHTRNDWKNYYSAIAVVPITDLADGTVRTPDDIWGFVCIDNQNGRFDQSAEDILRAFAQMYHFILVIISSLPVRYHRYS
jgi:hypothetical protein